MLRVAADVTMSQELKDDLLNMLDKPLSVEDLTSLETAVNTYQAKTKPIVDRALARLDNSRLAEIENIATKLVADTNTDVESYTQHAEKKDAANILVSL